MDIYDKSFYKEIAIRKVVKLNDEQVSKLLIFIAGMEAEYNIRKQTY